MQREENGKTFFLNTFPLMIALEGHSIHKYYFSSTSSSLAVEDYSCYKANEHKLTMNFGKTDYGNCFSTFIIHFHSLLFTSSMLGLGCGSIKLFSLTVLF